ncbi:MAG: hypothetical protein KKH01_00475 [Firmicutes bacterium]|nr:hypothetical protein [Bacillota bacterium]
MKKILTFAVLVLFTFMVGSLRVSANTGFTDAYELGSDNMFSGSLSPAGDIDYFHFKTPMGIMEPKRAYNVYTTGTTDTYGYLYEEQNFLWIKNYVLKDQDDDSGVGTNFRIEYDLNHNEDYYIKLKGYSSTTTGSYVVYAEPNYDKKYSTTGGTWLKDSKYWDGMYSPVIRKDYLTPDQVALYYYLKSDSLLGYDSVGNPITGDDMIFQYIMNGAVSAFSLVAVWVVPMSLPVAIIGAILYISTFPDNALNPAEEVYAASNATTYTYVVNNQVITVRTFHDPVLITYEHITVEVIDDIFLRYSTYTGGNYIYGEMYSRGVFVPLYEG